MTFLEAAASILSLSRIGGLQISNDAHSPSFYDGTLAIIARVVPYRAGCTAGTTEPRVLSGQTGAWVAGLGPDG